MAAFDTLDGFINSLSTETREALTEMIRNVRAEMFAARSEEARVRLAHEFIADVRKEQKKK